MDLKELVHYLGAVAASDGPIDGREKDLMRHLLRDFGASFQEAADLVASLPEPFPGGATLASLQDRQVALNLLRALLVISYCDGCFEREEMPYLTPIVEGFAVSGAELTRQKQQALYYLKLSPPSIPVPAELVSQGQWEAVGRAAKEAYQRLRDDYFNRFQVELKSADEETCYLAMSVGPPSFDISHTKDRFLQSNPDLSHLDEEDSLHLMRDEAERQLRSQWDSAYVDRCNFCFLEAPGKRRDLCPRCQAEYGEAARR